MSTPGIDPERLATVLAVLQELDDLPTDHPDAVRIREATAGVYKSVKIRRRREAREAILANDHAVTAATATAAPGRIDDETRGLPIGEATGAKVVGTLLNARSCYVCKQRYREVDAFYHQLCPSCAELNHSKREARTDLRGGARCSPAAARRSACTSRCGCCATARRPPSRRASRTTRCAASPRCRTATSGCTASPWSGLDLRDPAQVVALADSVAAKGRLDILVNNAAQTVRAAPRRTASSPRPRRPAAGGPAARAAGRSADAGAERRPGQRQPLTPAALTALSLTSGSASLDRVAPTSPSTQAVWCPDLAPVNSWTQQVHEVDTLEMLEVQLCNVTAPFVLVSRLRPASRRQPAGARTS
jgi:NAD(P)-dependent dehydrogenase (short-subunit alcohol dehydrogenase family)